ncbi:RNA-directed DNA polymerase [Hymenobacter sp. BT523]|uniref:RNA-directed DNA polymerase n=1 Tax=Hymenobacter sp. BT523 TaxID=2795725 RepID=UPI0018EB3BEC|nr:RNA-directed DNA polymerase [Hymenobacter sp. BT523]MBJ6109512.1 RNA-directed DNA polymerase [Hymenobacter sp. BT523]
MTTKDAINYSINNVISEGLTDIFDKPFEIGLLEKEAFRDKVYREAKSTIDSSTSDDSVSANTSLQELKVHPINYVLYPKKEAFDFRKCALIDPLDTIKYSALVLILASEIEKARINKTAKRVFSYRFKVEEEGKYVFDKSYTFTSFNDYVAENIKKPEISVLAKCDVSNFYDRLNIHRLESILLSITKKNQNTVKAINELLLFWANRDSYGLPVGSNPSRILAEAALIDVDKFLLSHNIDYCRYVDDFRIFAPNAKTAHYWLSLLVERLSIEGLFINQSKTLIEDVSDKEKFVITLAERTVQKAEKKKERRIIRSGYSGTIPTKFRNPSEHEIQRIKESTIDITNEIENAKIIKPDDFKEYCKQILYKEMFEKFRNLSNILEKFPQFTPYVVDLLIKHSDAIPKEIKTYLKNQLCKWLTDDKYLPEYIGTHLVKLLAVDGYKDTEVLFNYFRSLRRNAGSYIGRATLESLEKSIQRNQALEIRQYYNRADVWEKRQIARIIDIHLHKEEKNAWFKNLKMNESSDIFLMGIIGNK